MEPYVDPKRPLAEWAHWRGPIDINRFIREGMATEVEGKLWCHSEVDKAQLDKLILEDMRSPKRAP